MRLIHTSLFAAVAALGLSACDKQPDRMEANAPAATPTTPATPQADTSAAAAGVAAGTEMGTAATMGSATAKLAPTQGNEANGTVTFRMVDGRVHVTGQVAGLKPNSEHGFHIHEKGDCSAPDASSAGGHFNPDQKNHGSVAQDPHHGGDMANIKANAEGIAMIDAPVSSNVNIGKGDGSDIVGRGLIVHADPDDYTTQPTGNAGGRLACAVIAAQ